MPEIEKNETFLILRTANRREFKEIELLLLSRAIPFSVAGVTDGFFIPVRYESFAMAELRKYKQENRNWPPMLSSQKGLLFNFSLLHVIMVTALAFFHWHLGRLPEAQIWLNRGMLAVDLVLAGEWYRTVTALTLHVDTAHLISNIVGLLVFVGGVHQFAGPGGSWLLVLVAGALGNYLNALLYGSAHNAIGASTAVFGAVGLLGAFGVRRYLVQKAYRRRFFVPLIGAVGLFAMLGTSPQSDVMAHLFGLISGILIGFIVMPVQGSPVLHSRILQAVAYLAALVMIFISWRAQLGLPLIETLI